ncbi:MAG: hypothetical protein AAF934_02075 [Bacteroidota bacterium]
MSNTNIHINTALEIIRVAIQKSNPDKPTDRFLPADHRSTGWWDAPNEKPELSEVYPVKSWTLSAEFLVGIPDSLFEVGAVGEVRLVELSNGNFQLTLGAGASGGLGIPFTDSGVHLQGMTSVTFDLTPDELVALNRGNIIGILPSGVLPNYTTVVPNINPQDIMGNISAISVSGSGSLEVNLRELGLQGNMVEDIVNWTTGIDIPDSMEAGVGYEIRKDDHGNWEVVVYGETEVINESVDKSPGISLTIPGKGWEIPGSKTFTGILDTVSFFDASETSVTGSIDYSRTEHIYNTGTGETYTKTIERDTSFRGDEAQLGGDLLGLDEIVSTPDYPVLEGMEASFDTITTETLISDDNNACVIADQQTITSQGSFNRYGADIYVANAEIEATQETFLPPDSED